MAAAAAGRGEADDAEFLTLAALDLEPVAATSRAIWRKRALGDGAFEAELAGVFEEIGAAADEVRAEPDAARQRLFVALEQRAQSRLALDQRLGREIFAALVQQIEGVVHERGVVPCAQRIL